MRLGAPLSPSLPYILDLELSGSACLASQPGLGVPISVSFVARSQRAARPSHPVLGSRLQSSRCVPSISPTEPSSRPHSFFLLVFLDSVWTWYPVGLHFLDSENPPASASQ